MNTLTAQAVLQAWEHAQGAHPQRRAQLLLGAAWPEVPALAWGAMPVGAQDRCLFRLHEALFGTALDTLVACPACQEALQTRFSTTDLQPPGAPCDNADDSVVAPASFHSEGYELAYRLPCGDDLLALAETGDTSPAAAAHRLLARCVLEARHADAPTPLDTLPPAVIERLQQVMAESDPGADTSVALTCPACGHGFERRFDIGEYLWSSLDDWAQHTLADVHVLACAYGWDETQILALSATRRGHYIALVQA